MGWMDGDRRPDRFDDSEFDWDSLRPPPAAVDKPQARRMTRLAWIVLILLAFCPLVGFLLAYFS